MELSSIRRGGDEGSSDVVLSRRQEVSCEVVATTLDESTYKSEIALSCSSTLLDNEISRSQAL